MAKSFIALYGITNLGKTTQINLLKEHCKNEGIPVHTQKYPVYDLAPTGPLISEAVKGGNPKKLSAGEIQALFAKNRFDFQEQIENILTGNKASPYGEQRYVIAEMYTGTGISYGIGDGVCKEYILALNENLRVPDVAILLDGNRFMESVEKGHRFEENNEITEKIRKIHLELAIEMNWKIVNANRSIQDVHNEIWKILKGTYL